jgi:hypothetical protein
VIVIGSTPPPGGRGSAQKRNLLGRPADQEIEGGPVEGFGVLVQAGMGLMVEHDEFAVRDPVPQRRRETCGGHHVVRAEGH